MAKFSDTIALIIKSFFETGDRPIDEDFIAFIQAVQDGIQEHEHKSTGGAGSGTGDAAPITDFPQGANFHKGQAKNLVIHKGTAFPSNPAEGQEFYRTDQDKLYIYDGAGWEEVGQGDPVPSGAIMMFKSSCPSGWSRVTELDNRFPRGAATAGGTGGSETHRHQYGTGWASGSTVYVEPYTGRYAVRGVSQAHYTSYENHLPPYVDFVFCKKD